MKNPRLKLEGRWFGLGMVWRMIWSVFCLTTMRIVAPIAGRGVE